LLRLAFLESKRRSAVLESGWLKRVHVFRERLPMMHRAGWQGPRASSSIPFAWFVFDRDHRGPIELRRISWRSLVTNSRKPPGSYAAGCQHKNSVSFIAP